MCSRLALLGLAAALAAACGGHSGGAAARGPTLTVTVTGGGTVVGAPASAGCSAGSCSTQQPSGASITLTPVPSTGWSFTGWSGDCTGTGACSLTLTGNRTVTATFAPDVPLGSNVVALTVDGATCRAGSYQNKPCVRVTVCLPGTATCQQVDDVLLDTGSYGLRLFKEVVPFTLPSIAAGTGTLAECVQYLDGSADWGPVASADVVLGGEPAVRVPIQVIDATFGRPPASCGTPETSAAAAGFNGILGVGLFAEDCGNGCAATTANGIYFSCSGTTCGGVKVPLATQVANPVARLPADNNGVIVVLPALLPGGQASAEGALILGIDTQANNGSAGATAYAASAATGDLRTTFDGTTLGGFLDTGSNGLFFPAPRSPTLPACAPPDAAWYCPAATTSLSATNAGTTGSPSGTVTISIGNALALFGSGNGAIAEVGGALPAGTGFDFGLPFFFGRKIYVGIEATKASSLGTGPYFAY